MKDAYHVLVRFIKHAKKVIVSDALINDVVFQLLKNRPDKNKLLVINKFRKYKGIKAVRMRNEQEFLNKALNNCANKKTFLFGSDSAKTATRFFDEAKQQAAEEDKHRYLLITDKANFHLHNANEQFKGCYVFYSPKITYGVDFNNIEHAQDVFIYIKGNSIQPSGVFQQATRSRNIDTLYFYGEMQSKNAKYETLEALKQDYKEGIETSKQLTDMCKYLDVDDSLKFLENSFFNLWCYNKYVKDVFGTNKLKHFEAILKDKGFVLSSEGKPSKIDKETMNELKSLEEQHDEELFHDYLHDENKDDVRYDVFNENLVLLGLKGASDEELLKYKEIFMDNHKLQEHLNIIRLLRSDAYINDKLKNVSSNTFEIKTLTNIYNKIKLLRSIEKTYDMKPLEVDSVKADNIDMSDATFKLFTTLFRTKKSKPTTHGELMKLYIGIIKHITCNDLIGSKQNRKRTGGRRNEIDYELNID